MILQVLDEHMSFNEKENEYNGRPSNVYFCAKKHKKPIGYASFDILDDKWIYTEVKANIDFSKVFASNDCEFEITNKILKDLKKYIKKYNFLYNTDYKYILIIKNGEEKIYEI